MRKITSIVCVLWAWGASVYAQNNVIALASATQTEAHSLDSLTEAKRQKALKINDLMSQLYESNQFNGSVLVINNGEVLFHRAYGWAHVERRDTLTTATPFRLASVSKQFTAMAVMILKEQGKLSYDDDVKFYLPNFPYQGITIRDLLRHSSGLPDYFGIGYSVLNYFPSGKIITNKDLLEYFAVKKPALHFKTGKKASYSNTGFVFLALIIEKASGMSYPQFLQQSIFDPAGLKNAFVYNVYKNFETQTRQDTTLLKTDTVFTRYNEIQIETKFKVTTTIKTVEKKRAYGYELAYPYPQGFVMLDYHAFDGMVGEKGVCLSTADFIQWDKALYENKLISAETLSEAFTPFSESDRKEWRYGFGWKIYSKDYNTVFHHGLYRGFRNYFQRNLDSHNAIAILSNVQIGGKIVPIMAAINKILEGKEYKCPKPTRLEKDTQPKFKEAYYIKY
jgi:CubicO group peptidase (beta-lactamase class C family)